MIFEIEELIYDTFYSVLHCNDQYRLWYAVNEHSNMMIVK